MQKNYNNRLVRQNYSFESFKLNGIAWKILAHPSRPVVIVEVKNEVSRKTLFSAFNIADSTLLWENRGLKNSWWLGLESLSEDYVFVHGYADSQSPAHKGVTALDMKSGKQLWQNPDFAFAGFDGKDVLLSGINEREDEVLFKVAAGNGKSIEDVNVKINIVNDSNEHLLNAVHITPQDNQFERISDFVKHLSGHVNIMALDYLEYNDHIVIAFYTRVEAILQNYLMLVNANGKVLFCKLIEDKLKGIGKDAFFIFHNMLLFIENKTELSLYKF